MPRCDPASVSLEKHHHVVVGEDAALVGLAAGEVGRGQQGEGVLVVVTVVLLKQLLSLPLGGTSGPLHIWQKGNTAG